ncbi:DNA-binding transcriptional LysR family regulator [Paraburkholderia sp. GAS41]|uniref:hypothetical protein n=1 Tax=Paraburkholderia sp. GAS41 TaxID=3035134 RepID=UPI003D1C5C5E
MNTAESVAMGVRSRMGIGMLPVNLALDGLADRSLVRVLPQNTPQKMIIYALHPLRLYTDAWIRTSIEFLSQLMPTVIARAAHVRQKYNFD